MEYNWLQIIDKGGLRYVCIPLCALVAIETIARLVHVYVNQTMFILFFLL